MDDTRDRVIALERDVRHLTKKIEHMDTKVTEMHDLLLSARGARWMVLAMATVGGFVAAKFSTFLAFIGR